MKDLKNVLSSIKLDPNLAVPSFGELKSYLLEQHEKDSLLLTIGGKSANGLEILMVKIGNGKKIVAITGGAHADEPVGVATCFYLIKNLVENNELAFLKSEFTFLIHPCLDPDGALLNYSWANSHSYPDYLLKNFRNNNPSRDVEHGIPVKEGQEIRPELKKLMNNLLPYKNRLDFYVTLHTTHTLGGSLVLFFGDKNIDGLIEEFSKHARTLGSPVMDYKPRPDEDGLIYLAPGFLKSPSYNDFLNMFKDNPEALVGYKMSTYEWASTELNASLCMIAEFPYLQEEKMDNTNPSNIDYIQFKRDSLNTNIQIYHKVCEKLKTVESFEIDKTNFWYKKAVMFRDHALKSYQKDEAFFEQFNGMKATLGEVYYREIENIENEMKPSILAYHVLKGIPEAKKEFDLAMSEMRMLSDKWEQATSGRLLSTESQVRLQLLMILTGMFQD